MTRRPRMLSILAILATAVVALIASTQTWFTVQLTGGTDELLAVSGAAALPVLAPLALAGLALGAALSLAGRVLSVIVSVLTLAVGVVLAVLIWPLAVDPGLTAVAPTVTEATGLDGADIMATLVAAITPTPWPAISGTAAALLTAAGVYAILTAPRWIASGRRYRTAVPPQGSNTGELDAFDAWDGLSRGDDPTRP